MMVTLIISLQQQKLSFLNSVINQCVIKTLKGILIAAFLLL